MKIQIKNNKDIMLLLKDIDLQILPNTTQTIDTNIIPISQSKELIKLIINDDVIINDMSRDLLSTEAVKFITTNNVMPLDNEGKLYVHQTSKNTGMTTYWSGRGDDSGDIYDIGNGEHFTLINYPGEPSDTVKYMDLNTLDNKTDLHEGYFFWDKAEMGDYVSLSIVTNTVSIAPMENTNFNLYGGFLVVPAAGDGNIQVTSDIANPCIDGGSLVKVYTDETGYRPPAYWNATYNKTTRLFEDIQPAPQGDGSYNMYSVELEVNKFVNSIPLFNSGVERLQSSDSVPFPHGMRLKLEIITTKDDHEWCVGGMITMHRQKTIRFN